MPNPGEVFLLETPLPGETSGGAHLSVALSPAAFSQTNGFSLIAPLRSASPNAYRIQVRQDEFFPQGLGRPLDRARIIDLSQVTGIADVALGPVMGTVADRPLNIVLDRIPRQFQIGLPPWLRRGQVWRTQNGSEGVLIANDTTLGQARQVYHMCVPYASGPLTAPIVMLSAHDRIAQVGMLTDGEQAVLDQQLIRAFGLEASSFLRVTQK